MIVTCTLLLVHYLYIYILHNMFTMCNVSYTVNGLRFAYSQTISQVAINFTIDNSGESCKGDEVRRE